MSRARPLRRPRSTPRFGTRQSRCQPPRSLCASSGGLRLRSYRWPHPPPPQRDPPRGPRSRHSGPWPIGCVVLYHVWPAVLPAGYVGVDVFFVVSGFLITGLLLRDAERHGRISLREFYMRRARRILPAALVVLRAMLGRDARCSCRSGVADWFLQQIVASTLYCENWHLATDSQIPSAPTSSRRRCSTSGRCRSRSSSTSSGRCSSSSRSGWRRGSRRRPCALVAAVLAARPSPSFVHSRGPHRRRTTTSRTSRPSPAPGSSASAASSRIVRGRAGDRPRRHCAPPRVDRPRR